MTNAIKSMMDMWLRERQDNSSSSGKSNDSPRKSDSKTGAQLYRQFSLADIREATKDFSKSLLVRNSDKVYKGSVNIDGKALVAAIIRFKKLEGVGDEIHRKRLLLHPNILSPIGFCTEGDELIVVYDYMANGSLQDSLHHKDSPLPGKCDFKFALELRKD
ncbi:probable serine/threonine-protein kinase PBL7 [Rhododendron vialii]|uniref:probable serine/threonine-protein kinase PBL7 n=1 Tax=Rhododendron vialii TaxID=182163 RepID=UPI00265F0D37|nr:probable serine/threonine-protein kinase PBL7 [Rhododendron vialii]